MAARHFLDSGLKNFGYCASTSEGYSRARCEGFLEELAATGFRASVFADEFTGERESNWVRNRQKTNRWLRSLKKPVGLLCVHEPRALEVISDCRHMGLGIPDDVAVIAVGNDPFFCRLCSPPLSSIAVDFQQIGYQAAVLLDRLMRGISAPAKSILIPPHRVIVRQYTDIIAIEDADVAAGMRFIRDHADQPFNVKELMRQIPISRRLLEQRFKKFTGRTPSEEIMRVRIGASQKYFGRNGCLDSSGRKECRLYRVRRYSRRVFGVKMGMTPTEYRRRKPRRPWAYALER